MAVSANLITAAIDALRRLHGEKTIAPMDAMNDMIKALGEAEDAYQSLEPIEETPTEPTP